MVDESTRRQLASIPLLKTKAGPRDGELWVQRLKEEYQALIKVHLLSLTDLLVMEVRKLLKLLIIRYDTIGEFNVDWKAEYSALSSTRSQKKKLKQTTPVPL